LEAKTAFILQNPRSFSNNLSHFNDVAGRVFETPVLMSKKNGGIRFRKQSYK